MPAMPDRRKHRGPHPEDHTIFGAEALPDLREAVADLSWLHTRGYAAASAAKLVGDRRQLVERQRTAVQRCACSDQHLEGRRQRQVDEATVAGQTVWLDGFNVLTTVESALAGAFVFRGRDGCCRDMAGIHGHYKRVEETLPAIKLIGRTLGRLQTSAVVWYLDKPVSNSGRLAQWIRTVAAEHSWPWEVELVPDPDPVLARAAEIIASADSAVLDAGPRWLNLVSHILHDHVPEARIVDLS